MKRMTTTKITMKIMIKNDTENDAKDDKENNDDDVLHFCSSVHVFVL